MKATLDIPKTSPSSLDETTCLVATLMSLADLLIQQNVFSREQLIERALMMLEDEEIRSACDFAKIIAQRVFDKKFREQFEKKKRNTSGICPVLPTERRF